MNRNVSSRDLKLLCLGLALVLVVMVAVGTGWTGEAPEAVSQSDETGVMERELEETVIGFPESELDEMESAAASL